MLKKFISPIIYFLFFFPVIIGLIIITGFIENYFGFMFDMAGMIEMPATLLIYGGLLFGIANALMIAIEKTEKSFVLTHFRQSSIYYIIFFTFFSYFISLNDHGGMRGGMIAVAFTISAWAIAVNAIVLKIYSRDLKLKEKRLSQNK